MLQRSINGQVADPSVEVCQVGGTLTIKLRGFYNVGDAAEFRSHKIKPRIDQAIKNIKDEGNEVDEITVDMKNLDLLHKQGLLLMLSYIVNTAKSCVLKDPNERMKKFLEHSKLDVLPRVSIVQSPDTAEDLKNNLDS